MISLHQLNVMLMLLTVHWTEALEGYRKLDTFEVALTAQKTLNEGLHLIKMDNLHSIIESEIKTAEQNCVILHNSLEERASGRQTVQQWNEWHERALLVKVQIVSCYLALWVH
jgi:hypothetical protein